MSTAPGREHWLSACILSLEMNGINYTIHHGLENEGFEPAAIRWAYENCGEEFILMQDSIVVKNRAAIDRAFSHNHIHCFTNNANSFFCKFSRDALFGDLPPLPHSKKESINVESGWMRQFVTKNKTVWEKPLLVDSGRFETVFGERRMILENEWFWKCKGCWDPKMIKE